MAILGTYNEVYEMKKKGPKKRNPIARAVRKLRPQVIPDKRRKLRDKAAMKD